MIHYSPLRYPGGKNKLSAFIAKVCEQNNINGHYIEPYSGGASIALFLLLEGYVSKITINDKDKSIYAFWYSVINHTKEFCDLINKTKITISEWKRQKKVQMQKEKSSLLELGFSTFFLNRTNRSGILNAGVIGGLRQNGSCKIDCRYNKENLISRITKIGLQKNKIEVFNLDATVLLENLQSKTLDNNLFIYFDPPYYLKSSSLYMNHYNTHDHKEVSNKIKSIKNTKWVVSYDNVPEIKKLYTGIPRKEYSFIHIAHSSRIGNEILFFSRNLILPKEKNWDPLNYKISKNKIIYREKSINSRNI